MMSSGLSKKRQGFEAVKGGGSLDNEARGSAPAAICNPAFAGRAEAKKEACEKTSTSDWQDDAEVGDGRQRAKIRARDNHNIQRG